jgi:ribosomal-protein-alanine N-acetyltransferase
MRLTPTERWSAGDAELFQLEPAHATEAYVGWLADPAVNRFLESRFAPQGLDSVKAFVGSMLANDQVLFLGIRSRGLERHVGNVKLMIDRHHGLGEIGIMIGDREAWGRGLATGALTSLAAIAREELGLRKLTAGCYASNTASARAFQKAGFHIEGARPRHFLLEGRPEDFVLMARFLD